MHPARSVVTSIPRDLFPEHVARYLADLVSTLAQGGWPLASVAVFGSAARPNFAEYVSDVDLIIVLSDDVSRQDRHRVQEDVSRLEMAHGLRPPVTRPKGVLETFIDRAGGNALSSFVCSRGDLLAGDMAKAFFAFWNHLLLISAAFLVIPEATKHAMGTLKRSLHSCYFCYQLRAGPLEEEVAFFKARLGETPILHELLALRLEYRDSFGFVLRCLPTIASLHVRTARENPYPRPARRTPSLGVGCAESSRNMAFTSTNCKASTAAPMDESRPISP